MLRIRPLGQAGSYNPKTNGALVVVGIMTLAVLGGLDLLHRLVKP